MTRIADPVVPVTGGVDTHAEVHVAAVVDRVGRVLGTESFPCHPSRLCRSAGVDALTWRAGQGGGGGHRQLRRRLARHLAAQGAEVVEVIRPNRQARRQRGKF